MFRKYYEDEWDFVSDESNEQDDGGLCNKFGSEKGMGTVEIVIIIAVLVGIALIFRDSILGFATTIMDRLFGSSEIQEAVDPNSIRMER